MNSLRKNQYRLEELMPLFREQLAAGSCVRFFPNGTSMLPMIRQGVDSVTLAPLPERLKKHDLPLYQRDNGQFVLHRIVHVGQTLTCIGDNQFDKEYNLRHDQMIGLVVAFSRNGKEYSVTDWRYWLYCRFWYYSRPLRHFFRRARHWIRRHLK